PASGAAASGALGSAVGKGASAPPSAGAAEAGMTGATTTPDDAGVWAQAWPAKIAATRAILGNVTIMRRSAYTTPGGRDARAEGEGGGRDGRGERHRPRDGRAVRARRHEDRARRCRGRSAGAGARGDRPRWGRSDRGADRRLQVGAGRAPRQAYL